MVNTSLSQHMPHMYTGIHGAKGLPMRTGLLQRCVAQAMTVNQVGCMPNWPPDCRCNLCRHCMCRYDHVSATHPSVNLSVCRCACLSHR